MHTINEENVRLTEKELLNNGISCYDWHSISLYFNKKTKTGLSEDYIRKYARQLNWVIMSKTQKLSEELISDYSKKVDWIYISEYQSLSEPFIRRFQNKVGWSTISCKQKLSESFIEEFKDKVDWLFISSNQKLSESFIWEYKELLCLPLILKYYNLSICFRFCLEKFANKKACKNYGHEYYVEIPCGNKVCYRCGKQL